MSDNLGYTPGTGASIASDDIGGVQYQRIKLVLGSDGINNGDVSAANPIPVSAAILPLPTGAATAANQQTNVLTNTELRATAVPISAAALPLPTGAAADGTDGTTPPVILGGGTGIRGWLRSIYEKLAGSIAVTGTFWQTTQPVSLAAETTKVIGTVNVSAAQNISPFDVQLNQSVGITPLRELAVAIKTRFFGDSFANGVGIGDDIGTFPATPTVTGSATGAVSGGAFVFATGATIPSTGNMTSLLTANFVSGSVGIFQAGFLLPSASLTSFRVVSRKASVDTVVENAAFNVVPGTGAINDLFARFEIWYQANAAIFMVNGVAIHRMTGNINTPRTGTLDLPLAFTWANAAGPIATLRWGAFTAADGLFFEANYSVASVTGQTRGVTMLRTGPAASNVRPGTQQIATAISGANVAVTLTLAAAGAGLFHYITGVEIVNVNPTATAIAGSAVTLSYTTTNIPGAPAWTEGNALAAGVSKVVERIAYTGGIKTTAANTPTTFVAPAIGAGGLCRITVTYYIAS